MGSIQNFKELSIEGAFGIRPISSRKTLDHIPSFRRFDSVSKSIAAQQTVPETMCGSGPAISRATASVHESPSGLIPTASTKCTSTKKGFVMAPIPGDIEAPILETSVQPAVDNALGSVSVYQTVAVESRKNESAIVGREGKRQQSDFDHGSMSWFGTCFRGRVQV